MSIYTCTVLCTYWLSIKQNVLTEFGKECAAIQVVGTQSTCFDCTIIYVYNIAPMTVLSVQIACENTYMCV